jgi:VanZ family protein
MPDYPDSHPDRPLRAIYLLIGAGLLLALHLYRPVPDGLWQKSFFDAAHVPTFGVMAVLLLLATPSHWVAGRRFGTALVGAIGLSVMSELLQIPVERDASLSDLAADIFGSVGSLGIAASVPGLGFARLQKRLLAAGVGTMLLVYALAPFLTVSAAYLQRDRLFPVLVDLDTPFMGVFLRSQHAMLEQTGAKGDEDLPWTVRLEAGAWPGLIFHDIHSDWRGFSTLVIELGVEEGQPLDINVRVHDTQHRTGEQPFRDRFNRAFILSGGRQMIRIPLSEIESAPQGRQMALAQIDGIVVFCHAREAGREFRIGQIWLE